MSTTNTETGTQISGLFHSKHEAQMLRELLALIASSKVQLEDFRRVPESLHMIHVEVSVSGDFSTMLSFDAGFTALCLKFVEKK
jgi:hypothetical protein